MDVGSRRKFDEEWGPVLFDFAINQIPQGGADLSIREQWVGLVLPVRERPLQLQGLATTYTDKITDVVRVRPNGIPVVTQEAINVLREADKTEAVAYWETMASLGELLIFGANEGRLDPR